MTQVVLEMKSVNHGYSQILTSEIQSPATLLLQTSLSLVQRYASICNWIESWYLRLIVMADRNSMNFTIESIVIAFV